MATQYLWAEGLKIPASQLEIWLKQVPPGISLLRWCLEQNHVKEADYLKWAAETYCLPMVNADFFSQMPTPPERLRELIENEAQWTDQFFPIHIWDGVTFVGCTEPVAGDTNEQIKPLLAPLSELKKLWQKLHEGSSPAIEAPEGFSFDSSGEKPPGASTPGQPETEGFAAPEGLAGPEGLTIVPPEKVTKIDIPAPPPGIRIAPPVEAVVKPAETEPVKSAAPTPIQPEIKAEPMQGSHNDSNSLLVKFAPVFDRGMVLLFQNSKLKPWKWTGSWVPVSPNSPSDIPLDHSSVFKIVLETLMPYHGYVVGNPINNKFFQDWTGGKIPPHLTLVPLITNGSLAGMVLGTADKDPQPGSTLFHAEKLSMEFSNVIMIKSAAKAA